MNDPLSPELLAELCHDLRGPLGAIGTWVPVLKSERADGETRLRALTAMAGDVRALGALIDQISALAEALSGKAKISLVPIDVVPFVKNACASLAEDGSGFRFRADEASLIAIADAVRLRQIVELFASRALNTTQGGSRDLRLARRGHMAEFRVETTLTPRSLSVTLARALAEVQGGAFEESLVNGTTLLRVLLPIAP